MPEPASFECGMGTAGFGTADIHIHGVDDLPVEPTWVLAPVDGVRVDGVVRVGMVEFVDARSGASANRWRRPRRSPALS
jgi:hypothetical protein